VTKLPTGTVSFLYTDIEGSTRLWEQHPQAMHAALALHDRLLRQAIEAWGGHIFQTVGDAFYAAFTTAPAALAAAAAAQQALHTAAWGPVEPLRVRMALHTGPAEVRSDDYFGPTINRVAALLVAGHGGQVLVSAATRELLRDLLPPDFSLRDLGQRRLKDLTQPEQIYQLAAPGLDSNFGPLKTLDTYPNNLPLQSTSFLGRESELTDLLALLRRPDVRLLTLGGPGGSGKTRLSLQVAAALLDDYADGVYFVPLAEISDPKLVMAPVAQTLNLAEMVGQPYGEAVKAYGRERSMLLVLDNFEQVVEAAVQLGELLTAAPRLKLLVTSREVLHLYGEQEYAVPPLALPDLKQLPPLDELEQYAAVALFVARVQTIRHDFRLTPENARAVAEICSQLDGLPLAIELATARSKLFSPQMMLDQLSNHLKVLTSPMRDLTPRQQSLRGAIDWSYNLLSEGERLLFARLAVFVGGCTPAAGEEVCSGEGLSDLPESVFESLVSLVDKSLLRQATNGASEPRFVMLDTIRDYAAERLNLGGEAEAVRRRHAMYYVAFAEQVEDKLVLLHDASWLGRVEQEYDNLRTAMQWCSLHEPGAGLRLAVGIREFWYVRGYLSEGRGWLERLVQAVGDDLPLQRAKALVTSGILATYEGDYVAASRLLAEGEAVSESCGYHEGVASALRNRGYIAYREKDYARARALYEQGMALSRRTNDPLHMAAFANSLGMVAYREGDYDAAQALYEQGLAGYRELGSRRDEFNLLHNLAHLARHRGNYQAAAQFYRQAINVNAELGEKVEVADALEGLAATLCDLGEARQAVLIFAASSSLRELVGVPISILNREDRAQQLAAARASLTEQDYDVAWQQGRRLSLAQAIALALNSALATTKRW